MTYTITTDEPIEKWCRPLHEGQVIEQLEQSPLKYNPGMTTPHKRRFAAMMSSTGELVWMEIPITYP